MHPSPTSFEEWNNAGGHRADWGMGGISVLSWTETPAASGSGGGGGGGGLSPLWQCAHLMGQP